MRITHGKRLWLACFILAGAAGLAALPRTAVAGEDNPFPYRPSPALPSQDDLVSFDDPAIATLPEMRIDIAGANQSAFPLYHDAPPPEAPAGGSTSDPAIVTDQAFAPASPLPPPAMPSTTPLVDFPAASGTGTGVGDLAALPANSASPIGTPLPPPPLPELPATQMEPTLPKPDIEQVRADFNELKGFCESDSLGSAAEVYARMPQFGADEDINRLRADAANLLILGLSRTDNLAAARRVYDSVPNDIPGYDASLAKARGVINLATYYVRAERYNDAFDVLMDIGAIRNRSALNNELFRLMARMIPYLDNAEETEKATAVFDLLLSEVASPGGAALFAENIQGVIKYYLHYVDKTESPIRRRKRLDFLEHAFAGLKRLDSNPDVHLTRKNLGAALAERYAGNPERAARFFVED
ncbi:MAG: hypothetical protein LUC93_00755 [Planctomycetaceae bacterium]|nr:hypothetical protein [Planctomycetaceae bacterium]